MFSDDNCFHDIYKDKSAHGIDPLILFAPGILSPRTHSVDHEKKHKILTPEWRVIFLVERTIKT